MSNANSNNNLIFFTFAVAIEFAVVRAKMVLT